MLCNLHNTVMTVYTQTKLFSYRGESCVIELDINNGAGNLDYLACGHSCGTSFASLCFWARAPAEISVIS